MTLAAALVAVLFERPQVKLPFGSTSKSLSVFFSNFSEAGVKPFSPRQPIGQEDLLWFALRHAYINGGVTGNGLYAYLNRNKAKEIVQRYFGRELTMWRSTGSAKMVGSLLAQPNADGEPWFESEFQSLTKVDLVSWQATIYEFMQEPSDEHRRLLGTRKALLRRKNGRWILVGYGAIRSQLSSRREAEES